MAKEVSWQSGVLFGDPIGAPKIDASFDYIVVGGGTSGLAVAARLAEDPSVTVAVVEAGGFYELDNGQGSITPALAAAQTASTDPNFIAPMIDWGFVTVPMAGINNRRIHYARGKTLGVGGTKGTHKAWADKIGDENYTWDNILQYYKKGTRLTPPNYDKRQVDGKVLYDATAFQNSPDSRLDVTWSNWAMRSGRSMIDAMSKAGISETTSFDDGSILGAAWSSTTLDPTKNTRVSSKTAYLELAVERSSIKVYTKTRAEKILFDGTTAEGVLVNTDGESYTLKAKKEIIVTAGAFQSPQLLMVSGVGPMEILAKHNIPMVANVPGVGQNMRDHVLFGISYRVTTETASRIMSDPVYAQHVATDFTENGAGPLTSPFGPLGFEKISGPALSSLTSETQAAIAHLPADWPEIEFMCIDAHCGDCSNFGIADPADGHNYLTLLTGLMTDLSRGSIGLASASTADSPVINMGYLTHPAELEIAVVAFKRIRDIWDHAGAITVGPEYYPGRDVVRSDNDDQIREFVRNNLAPVFHAAGTCAMGKADDEMTVLDSECRVRGVQSLRVVDASSFPLLPPCHPQATIYALAEKIADDIKNGR